MHQVQYSVLPVEQLWGEAYICLLHTAAFLMPCHAQAVLVCLSVLNTQLREAETHLREWTHCRTIFNWRWKHSSSDPNSFWFCNQHPSMHMLDTMHVRWMQGEWHH